MLTEIGKFLRRYRIDNGLLLKDMAGKVGVTSAYLSAVENGKKRPTEDLVGKIINAYDLDSEKAAELKCDTLGCSVLLKGGHQLNDANDLLFQKGKEPVWFYGKRINNPNTHGTGCTLSSAIASNLAKGRDLETSVRCAKNYISGALAAMLDIGKGSGPMNHAFAIDGEYRDLREQPVLTNNR